MKKEKATYPVPDWCTKCKMNRTYFDLCGKCQYEWEKELMAKIK